MFYFLFFNLKLVHYFTKQIHIYIHKCILIHNFLVSFFVTASFCENGSLNESLTIQNIFNSHLLQSRSFPVPHKVNNITYI